MMSITVPTHLKNEHTDGHMDQHIHANTHHKLICAMNSMVLRGPLSIADRITQSKLTPTTAETHNTRRLLFHSIQQQAALQMRLYSTAVKIGKPRKLARGTKDIVPDPQFGGMSDWVHDAKHTNAFGIPENAWTQTNTIIAANDHTTILLLQIHGVTGGLKLTSKQKIENTRAGIQEALVESSAVTSANLFIRNVTHMTASRFSQRDHIPSFDSQVVVIFSGNK